ncbi:hypothetical protein BTH42_26415 [Burkholderia sp. SRS-W-2-2016]|uniref:DUF4381 domain-containing protein n=1 Tax=Burkholderia sp. SRS-W-2-2016 TaxID=1926878 RepID=UPI00094B10D3|nr:DUF4381 domain-containing protein [Burkholderia sp. SRS-W-2-2016]OLL28655.1 hypothetical protein BTH42_26415 [Burkholderia sp. SRS-W-2-2016]
MSALAATPAAPDPSGQLHELRELPLPSPVSYAPQTVGWLIVAALLLALLATAGWCYWRRRRRQRYRRAALAELRALEARLAESSGDVALRASTLAALPGLLKRTALAAAPRAQVASLTGADWLAYLQRTRGHFDARSGAWLALASYAPAGQVAAISPAELAALIDHARDWIEHHHVEI